MKPGAPQSGRAHQRVSGIAVPHIPKYAEETSVWCRARWRGEHVLDDLQRLSVFVDQESLRINQDNVLRRLRE